MLTRAELLAALDYDAETGIFTHRRKYANSHSRAAWFNSRWGGKPAGKINEDGYVVIKINGRMYFAARLAWFYVTGEWPTGELDHRDRDRTNNRFSNLRPATRVQNAANRNASTNNTSGFKGVTWNKSAGKWQAQIGYNGKLSYLGVYASKEDAASAYSAAAIRLYGEFAA